MSKKTITQEKLKELLNYDQLTGLFHWKTLSNHQSRVHIGDIAGSKRQNGYNEICISGKLYKAHRLAWLYVHGYFPETSLDHINRIRDDNRIENLREASRQCNSRNSNIRCDNTSGVTGVCWSNASKKWVAAIAVNRKTIHLGRYKSKLEAVKARWNAEVKHGFPNCNTTSSAYLYLKLKGELNEK